MGQLVRALEAEGPCTPEELAMRVGATYWEQDRFDRALGFATADGLVTRSTDGLLHAV